MHQKTISITTQEAFFGRKQDLLICNAAYSFRLGSVLCKYVTKCKPKVNQIVSRYVGSSLFFSAKKNPGRNGDRNKYLLFISGEVV